MKLWKNISYIPKVVPDTVPDGESGPWKVATFEVTKEAELFGKMRAVISSERGRFVPAGSYKALKRDGHTIMSNTPDEIRDCYDFFSEAKGRVLINGLGLGIALDVILNKVNEDGTHAVTSVTVIEKSPDVIKLVAPTFIKNKRVKINLADALEFKAEGVFDAVYHDIWDAINSDNLVEMKKLHRIYGRKTEWQGSWCRDRCEYSSRRGW
jgi:hypothetical protein